MYMFKFFVEEWEALIEEVLFLSYFVLTDLTCVDNVLCRRLLSTTIYIKFLVIVD
jgi:hypothetical protein